MPAWLERVVLRCLAKEPRARFESARTLAVELRRPRGATRTRSLPGGDRAVEDPGSDHALVLETPAEKTGWTPGMALHFEGRHLQLTEIAPPERSGAWTYRFSEWPEGQIFRRLVDYERDLAERREVEQGRLGARLARWMKG